MQKQNSQALLLGLALATAFVLIAGLIVVPGIDQQQSADAQGKSGKDKDKQTKTKPSKGKSMKPVKINVYVDASQVANATDAAAAYQISVTAGGVTAKAKSLEINMTEEADLSNLKVPFNGKIAVAGGDTFTALASSASDAYVDSATTGTFTEKQLGNSGKTTVEGNTDSPLVFEDSTASGLE